MVSYTYDAWGKLESVSGSLASTNGELNPFRYYGYYYDTECGLYSLQSRYYDPVTSRFINADSYTTTGQGVNGNNMFVYCENNPVNRQDTTGCLSGVLRGIGREIIRSGGESLVLAAADGPLPFGDVAAVANFVIDLTLFARVERTVPSGVYGKFIPKALEDVAKKYKEYECVDAAKEMQRFLTKNKLHGTVITIKFTGGKGYVWSESKQKVISTNGIHVGILYNGMVYCNIHPQGLPEQQWTDDFYGTGYRTISKIEF